MFITHEGQEPVNMSLVVDIYDSSSLNYDTVKYTIVFNALQEDADGDRIVLASWEFYDKMDRDEVYNNIKEKFFIEV